MNQEVKSLTFRINRFCIAALIVAVIFSFPSYNNSNEIAEVKPQQEFSFNAKLKKQIPVKAPFPVYIKALELPEK